MSKRQQETSNIPQEEVLVTLTLDQIIVDEANNLSRYAPNAKDITDLAQDIVTRGQLQPVVVRPHAGNGNGDGVTTPYRLVAGFQRYRAIAQANEAGNKLPILARVVQADDKEALLDNLAENIKRRNQSPMDISFTIKSLTDSGMTQKEIAKEYGKSGSWVSNHTAFITLRPQIQKQIHTGMIPFSVARNLPQLDEAGQDELLANVQAAIEAGESGTDAAVAGRQGKKGKSKRGAKSKGEILTGKGGISAKAALGQFERLTLEYKEVEKPNKGQTKAMELYAILTKFLNGKLGAQAMDNRVRELF